MGVIKCFDIFYFFKNGWIFFKISGKKDEIINNYIIISSKIVLLIIVNFLVFIMFNIILRIL